MQIFYTRTFREYDAGVFQVGDPLVMLQGQQVGTGITKHTFTCPSTCTQRSDVPLTIFGEGLHMVCPNEMLPLQLLSCLFKCHIYSYSTACNRSNYESSSSSE